MKTKFNIRYGIVSYDSNYVSEIVYEKKTEFKGSELAAKSKATRLMNADPEMEEYRYIEPHWCKWEGWGEVRVTPTTCTHARRSATKYTYKDNIC